MRLITTLLIALCLGWMQFCFMSKVNAASNVTATSSFFDTSFLKNLGDSIKEGMKGSRYVCTKYERRPYNIAVAVDKSKIPYTELFPKKRVCVKWIKNGDGAVKRKCVKYKYLNTSKAKEKRKYKKVKRHKTVCIEGYYKK